MAGVDPATRQWREMFSASVHVEMAHQREMLEEIRKLARSQNNRVRQNELAIASLKTWVALVGGLTGVGTVVSGVWWLLR